MRSRFQVAVIAAAVALAGVATYQVTRPKQQAVIVIDPAKVIVIRTPGGLLEVATLKRDEEFGWSTRYRCPLIDCPEILQKTISRVRVPVHYVYRIPLAERWELVPRGDHYALTVPGLEPQRPVAFDTSKLQVESTRGWFTPPARGVEQSLMRELGPELERRASQDHYLRLAEPYAMATVQEFARKWMAEQKLPADKRIQVRFQTSP